MCRYEARAADGRPLVSCEAPGALLLLILLGAATASLNVYDAISGAVLFGGSR
jgi:hypothetical protein